MGPLRLFEGLLSSDLDRALPEIARDRGARDEIDRPGREGRILNGDGGSLEDGDQCRSQGAPLSSRTGGESLDGVRKGAELIDPVARYRSQCRGDDPGVGIARVGRP